MSAEWYYQLMGEDIGPLSLEELKGEACAGTILPDTFVKRGKDGDYVCAEGVEGLFSEKTSTQSASTENTHLGRDSEIRLRKKAMTKKVLGLFAGLAFIIVLIKLFAAKDPPPAPTKEQIAEDLTRELPVAIYAEGMEITHKNVTCGVFGGGEAYYMLEAPSSEGTIFSGHISYRVKDGKWVPDYVYMRRRE